MDNNLNGNYTDMLRDFTASVRRINEILVEFANYRASQSEDVALGYNIAFRFVATLEQATRLSVDVHDLQWFYSYDEAPVLSNFLRLMPRLHRTLIEFQQNLAEIFRPEPADIEDFIDEPHRICMGK
jgi:hypothetical protein